MPDAADWLAAYGARQWAWGRIDCSLMLAEWALANGWPDPAAGLRGTYGGPVSCARLVRRAGGLLALVGGRLDAIGLRRAAVPAEGVIGIVGAASGIRQWGAIRAGGRWRVRIETGVIALRAAPLGMWSV